jgi:L,D-peptidoglycan transpeptidase YkuD (ErfK/YbiS/YcfS/YnhG family)
MQFVVRRDSTLGTVLDWGAGARRCAIGRGGIAVKTAEGDGVTPLGTWPIRRVLYRADRLDRPQTELPLAEIAPDDGWCDAPTDPRYNTQIKLPYAASHESLWRRDRLYDVIAVLGFNDDPVTSGKGSAIFLHMAREGYAPTEGCVALALPDLLDVLRVATAASTVRIVG